MPTRESFGGKKLEEDIQNNSHLMHTGKDDKFAMEVCSLSFCSVYLRDYLQLISKIDPQDLNQANIMKSLFSNAPNEASKDPRTKPKAFKRSPLSLRKSIHSEDMKGWRTLKEEHLDWVPLESMPFNEGTFSGTIGWLRNVDVNKLKLDPKKMHGRALVTSGKSTPPFEKAIID